MSKYTYLDRNGVPSYRDAFGEEHKMKVGTETGKLYKDTDSVQKLDHFTKLNVPPTVKQLLNKQYGMVVQKLDEQKEIQLMIEEATELQLRIEKLEIILNTKTEPDSEFVKWELKDEDLMRRQVNAMKQYFEFLVMRLEMRVK